jgi:elongation factor P
VALDSKIPEETMQVTELRNGHVFYFQNELYMALAYEHIKMGRGGAVIKIKARNLKTTTTRELSFNNGATVDDVELYRDTVEYIYADNKSAYFKTKTEPRITVPIEVLGSNKQFLKAGQSVPLVRMDDTDEPIDIEVPNTVDLKVTEAPPNEKGNSTGSVTKPVTLETGLVVNAPMFIAVGDIIKVNTVTTSYIERVSK